MKPRMQKRVWYILSAALVLGVCLFWIFRPSGQGTYDNLIRNGDFEQVSNGLPAAWYTDAYFPQTSYTTYDTDEGVTGLAGHIRNHYLNDARFAQTVSVSPNTLYCLRGWIRADAQQGWGANLSIEGITVLSQSVYDLADGWQEVFLYGRTGKSQTSVTVFARLGGYSGEATGEAWFDDITLSRVDAVPAGFRETDWAPQAYEEAEEAASTGAGALILCLLAYAALFALLAGFLRQDSPLQENGKRELISLAAVLALGLAVRCLTAAKVQGYDVDIGCFRSWSDFLSQVGPLRFYQEVGFCDYPPGYLWILWALGGIGQWMGTGVTEFMVKLPPILADLALCALLYTEGRKRLPGKAALALAALYALNPLILVTGAAWGQADAVMLLLLFLAVLFAVRGKWAAALPLYVASVLAKPQALMFGPLGLAALILHLIQHRKDEKSRASLYRDAAIGLLLAAGTAALLAGPFVLRQEKPLAWLISLYQGTMGQYGYVTVNACNLYFLLGKNWVDAASSLSGGGLGALLLSFSAVALPLLAAFLLHGRAWRQTREGRVRLWGLCILAALTALALSLLYVLGALTWAALGAVMIASCVSLFIFLYLLRRDAECLPLFGAALLLALFNTGTMMHERYLFPAVGLLFMAYFLKKDRRILYLALGVSLFGFLNVGCCLDRNIRIGGAAGHLNAPAAGIYSDMTALEVLSAAGNCLMGIYAVYLSAVLSCREAAVRAFRAAPAREKDGPRRAAPLPVSRPLPRMGQKDWLILAAVTMLYGALALTNLGSAEAPQTAWVSRQEDECVILDLGESRDFYMLYYPGIHWRSDWESADFDVQTSLDGETWESGYAGSVRSGTTYDCFSWKYVTGPVSPNAKGALLHGRYVRLISQFPELTLFEVLLRDAESGAPLPIRAVSDTVLLRDAESGRLWANQTAAEPLNNETLPFLTDEQDTLAGEPSWYNSTYFDEIYHARTAYEHLHGLPVYETTHPPLGKLLMSAAIALFGMTPFGWRFAGALAGILMLPGMYLLGKLLIRKKWGGAAAALLMALDLMHFTQTRIATIDSFVVLFIIWSVYFMLRWFFLDDPGVPLRRSLIPLALSGLFMGLAIASKWTGCYAGAGLAVLFFYGIYRRWRRAMADRKARLRQAEADAQAASREGKSAGEPEPLPPLWRDPGVLPLILTVLSCLLFFVAVPLLIYYASYIPYFAREGGVTVQKVIKAAEHMLAYHATPGLGMDHYFYSPWYQWPVIAKPMWYYSGSLEPEGTASTIMALGNPAVWWTGLAGLMGVCCLFVRRHYDEKNHALSLYAREDDPRFALLLICFLAQYLPWVPVPRGTYIYHYFPSVPFIILCTLLCLDALAERREKAARIAVWALVCAAAILFIAFFPYASGIAVSTKWLDAMQWFPRWLWY